MNFFHRLTAHSSWGLLALRLSVGSIFLFHGIQKWAFWGAETPSGGISPEMVNLFKFLSIVEPLGGIALIFGFLTQLAALSLALVMAGAIYFKIKVWGTPFASATTTGWEFDLALLGSNIALFFLGAGKIALDKFLMKK